MATPPQDPSGQPGEPQPTQPGQPQQPPAGAYGDQTVQAPVPGQPAGYPQQPGAYPQYGQPGAYPAQPGAIPPGGFPPPAPQPPANRGSSAAKKIGAVIAAFVIVAVIAVAASHFRNKDDGKTVDTTQVGSCITATGSSMSIKTEKVDCKDTSAVSFIVGAKLDTKEACESAKFTYYVSEYGSGASDKYLCLVPNYQLGNCYEESSISVGIDLKTVPCSQESTVVTAVYKITERVESSSVPNCTDTDKQKVLTFDIQSSPARQLGVCAEIQGDYTWQ
ncbi:MAG: hypothetical protein QM658_16985 [Gordonia sp. (in: high G+C Gram-positive bacteria)]